MEKKCKKCGKRKDVSNFKPRRGICNKCQQARITGWNRENRDARKYTIQQYGLTVEAFEAMLAEQHGVCGICGQPETKLSRWGTIMSLSIDHNHTTGEVRGLLCARCNMTIGQVNEDTEVLSRMINYLGK